MISKHLLLFILMLIQTEHAHAATQYTNEKVTPKVEQKLDEIISILKEQKSLLEVLVNLPCESEHCTGYLNARIYDATSNPDVTEDDLKLSTE